MILWCGEDGLIFFFKLQVFLFFKLFIYWLHWVFDAACRLSLVVESGHSSLQCAGFSELSAQAQ